MDLLMNYMNKLLLALVIATSVTSLVGMEPQEPNVYNQQQCMTRVSSQIKPFTFAQAYHYFSHDLLLPEIAQQIFLLQLGNINLEKLPESCKDTNSLVEFIAMLTQSWDYPFAGELCERFFSHEKISICDVKKGVLGKSPLHHAINYGYLNVTRVLIKIAGDKTWTLLAMKDYSGSTALHYVACRNNREGVKLLLDAAGHQAPELIAMKNGYDETAFDLAHITIQKIMQNYMPTEENMSVSNS